MPRFNMAEESKSDVELTTKSQAEDTDKIEDNMNKATSNSKIESDAKVKSPKKKAVEAAEKEEEDNSESSEGEELLGIYDKPAVIEGKRQRKSTEFLHTIQQSERKEPKSLEFKGKGEKLANIERVVHELSQSTSLELKPLHKLLFGREGRQSEIKKNIRNFNGYSFEKESKEYEDKVARVERFTNQGLQRLCEIFDIEKKGKRDEVMPRILEFLMSPKPSGKPLPEPKKKTTKAQPKKKKAKKSKESEGKGKKRKTQPKSKEEVDDESDKGEEGDEEDETEEVADEPPKKKKKTEKPKAKATPEKKSSPKKKAVKAKDTKESTKKKSTKDKDKKTSKKAVKKGGPVAVKITPLKKGSPKKTPKKVKPKPVDDGSLSDEEPLSKKAKKPPSDDELEKVVRGILDGADLEHVTMKSVCKQVFEKYPDYDLSIRKDFIKETVRKVIS